MRGGLTVSLLLWLLSPGELGGKTLDRAARQFVEEDPFVIGFAPELSDNK